MGHRLLAAEDPSDQPFNEFLITGTQWIQRVDAGFADKVGVGATTWKAPRIATMDPGVDCLMGFLGRNEVLVDSRIPGTMENLSDVVTLVV